MKQLGLHCIVSGRVQGVFYRATTQKKAKELNLVGWVRNLPDGSVELEAFGTEEQVQALQQWLWQGPPAAQVTNVESVLIPYQLLQDFVVR